MAEFPNMGLDSSFRDPSGFLFERDGVIYRQVSNSYRAHYDKLVESGLYAALTAQGLSIPHEEVAASWPMPPDTHKVLRPERIPFISYPYEWSFSELKDAALLTLKIQEIALAHGMTLKDASAYNVQFRQGRPVFIDTLSFEIYRPGQPWQAYRQFCQHFFAPLLLMSTRDVRLNQLFRVFMDGVPLDLADSLMSKLTHLRPSAFIHVHLHSRFQRQYGDQGERGKRQRVGVMGLRGLVDNLASSIRRMRWRPAGTTWADYYAATNYTDAAMEEKGVIVKEFLERIHPATVWDVGANNGHFSRIAANLGCFVAAMDFDPAAVEQNYLACRQQNEKQILPLVMDLTNPSGGIGWNNRERMSLAERGPADAVLALALIHHLAIGNNVPLSRLAQFLASLGRQLIVEFVPKEDSQVQRLLAGREDIFPRYARDCFEQDFGAFFRLVQARPIQNSLRILYHFEARG
jgi:ribosomal protein L11 methylase PrmA